MKTEEIIVSFQKYDPEVIFSALKPFVKRCSMCREGLMIAILKRYGDALVFECLDCGEGVTSGNEGRLIDRYAELRKKNGQSACYYPDCDRPGEAEAEISVKLCWKHLGYKKKK